MAILIVTQAVDGIFRIGTSMPTKVPLDHAKVQVYEVTGPFALIEGPGIVEALDISKWLEERRKVGFEFKLLNDETKPPQSEWAKEIKLNTNYTADDIASVFKKPKKLVDEWMDNWQTQKHPMLHFRMDGTRTCNAFQLLKFIQDYGPYLKN